MLDDCNFHESVSLEEFERHRSLSLRPPDGEVSPWPALLPLGLLGFCALKQSHVSRLAVVYRHELPHLRRGGWYVCRLSFRVIKYLDTSTCVLFVFAPTLPPYLARLCQSFALSNGRGS